MHVPNSLVKIERPNDDRNLPLPSLSVLSNLFWKVVIPSNIFFDHQSSRCSPPRTQVKQPFISHRDQQVRCALVGVSGALDVRNVLVCLAEKSQGLPGSFGFFGLADSQVHLQHVNSVSRHYIIDTTYIWKIRHVIDASVILAVIAVDTALDLREIASVEADKSQHS